MTKDKPFLFLFRKCYSITRKSSRNIHLISLRVSTRSNRFYNGVNVANKTFITAILCRTIVQKNFFGKIIFLRIKTYVHHNYHYGKLIKKWSDEDLFLLTFLTVGTSNRSNANWWVSVQFSVFMAFASNTKILSVFHIMLLNVERQPLFAFVWWTMGVNNNVDYCEPLQLQLIWIAAIGTFSSQHNGSQMESNI